MTQKTNAVRLLDQMGIRYELLEYEVDPVDLAAETVENWTRFESSDRHRKNNHRSERAIMMCLRFSRGFRVQASESIA